MINKIRKKIEMEKERIVHKGNFQGKEVISKYLSKDSFFDN